MHETRIDIPAKSRTKVVETLNARLADALDLALQSKQAHWNVKGPSFIALHELFDKVAEAFEGSVDEIAERITALGGTAYGTVGAIARNTSLAPYPEDIYDGTAHVEALANAIATFGKKIRKSAEVAEKAGDSGTEDLFISISQEADKYLWFLEAHLQGKR